MVESIRPRQYFKFLLLTGARRAEAANAQWGDIRLNDDTPNWTIPLAKNNKRHIVVLNPVAVELITQLRRLPGNPYLFPGGHPYQWDEYVKPMNNPTKAFKRILKRAGIKPPFCVHQLRHTHASIIINAGGNLYDVQKALNHSSYRMAQRYSHLSNERIERTGLRIAEVIGKAMENN